MFSKWHILCMPAWLEFVHTLLVDVLNADTHKTESQTCSGAMSGGADRQQKAQKPSLRAARLSQSCRKRLVLCTSTALRQFLSDSCTAQSCSPGTSVSGRTLRWLAAGDSNLHGCACVQDLAFRHDADLQRLAQKMGGCMTQVLGALHRRWADAMVPARAMHSS